MKTWKDFYEAKQKVEKDDVDKEVEDKEEKLGMDLDDDDEEGESCEHKKKVGFCKKCKK